MNYHVALVHRIDHHQLYQWDQCDGHPMDYHEARRLLIAIEQKVPGLHTPGMGYYLIAKPMRGVR